MILLLLVLSMLSSSEWESHCTLEGRDPNMPSLIIDPLAFDTLNTVHMSFRWADTLAVCEYPWASDLNTISLGASEDIEIRGDTLFLRDRGIQFIFQNSTNLFLRFTDTGNSYSLE